MADILHFKDLEKLDISEVTQEWIDYFYRLSEKRQGELLQTRPDLVEYIYSNIKDNSNNENNNVVFEDDEKQEDVIEYEEIESIPEEINETTISVNDPIFNSIRNNIYKNENILDILKDDLKPIEALTINDNAKRCPVHKYEYKKCNIKYHENGRVTVVDFLLCPMCNRLFIEKSYIDYYKKNLNDWGVEHKFYDYKLSSKYLSAQVEPYEIKDNEPIYILKPGDYDIGQCPIHSTELEKIKSLIRYKGKEIRFDALYCDECGKLMMSNASASDLDDECAKIGIPQIEFKNLIEKKLVKVTNQLRDIKPDYIINKGKLEKNVSNVVKGRYKLNENDTIVVSDSIYCDIEGHKTEETLGLVPIHNKYNENKIALCMFGYCSNCRKYYIDEDDYNAMCKEGRAGINTIFNVDDSDYMITSGDIYNFENDHLLDLEGEIDYKINEIKGKSDYVNEYETLGYYDEGNLAIAKSESKNKYGKKLAEYASYKIQPYKYHVDISNDKNSKTYYLGMLDITLDSKEKVISLNSDLGRKLVNYRTKTINTDNKEYSIKLIRELDIDNAFLYGYKNIRNEKDDVYRKGLTDRFLIKVLNERKRQHNLVDIFVTIQENQNSIVDEDYNKNIIVQGCAGSGKTMVLLHRLSNLKYNYQDYDFNSKAMILTPSDNFSLHIDSLAENLQIGAIKRISVEKYYAEMLELYSEDFKIEKKITSETYCNQKYVDYIYSDDFKREFFSNYSTLMKERNKKIPEITTLLNGIGLETKRIDKLNNALLSKQIKEMIENLYYEVSIRENAIKKTLDDLNSSKEEKDRIVEKIKTTIKQKENFVLECIPLIRKKAQEKTQELNLAINDNTAIINKLKEEQTELINRIDGGDAKLTTKELIDNNKEYLDEQVKDCILQIKNANNHISEINSQLLKIDSLLEISLDDILGGKTVDDNSITDLQNEIENSKSNIELLKAKKIKVEETFTLFGKQRRINKAQEVIDVEIAHLSNLQEQMKELYLNQFKIKDSLINEKNNCLNDIESLNDQIKLRIIGNKHEKIKLYDEKISEYISNNNDLIEKVGHINKLVSTFEQTTNDDGLIRWIDAICKLVPDADDEKIKIKNIISTLQELDLACKREENNIIRSQKGYENALSKRVSENVRNSAISLHENAEQYEPLNTYKQIFEKTVNDVKDKYKVKSIPGKTHRYDLYAMLMFAMEYFDNLLGTKEFICVDEGQDLSINEYKLISDLCKKKPILNIFGDTRQLLKPGRGIDDWKLLLREFNMKKFVLNENYRNTNQITRLCNDSFNMNMLQTGVDGPIINEISIRKLEDDIIEKNLNKKTAIIISRGIRKKDFIDKYFTYEAINELIDYELSDNKITLMYIDETKGLEFEKVYVVATDMNENERYVAYTRATYELVLVQK